jgi:anti-anti-sigma factor
MPDNPYRRIQANCDQGVLVLKILDKAVGDYELCLALRQEFVDAFTQSRATNVVCDFSMVEFMASCGFLPLLNLKRKVSDAGGKIVLCNLSKAVRGMFQATRLLINPSMPTGLFEEQADVTAGLAYLG